MLTVVHRHLESPTPRGPERIALLESTGWASKDLDRWFASARAESGWNAAQRTARRPMSELIQLWYSFPSSLVPAERVAMKRLQAWLDAGPTKSSVAIPKIETWTPQTPSFFARNEVTLAQPTPSPFFAKPPSKPAPEPLKPLSSVTLGRRSSSLGPSPIIREESTTSAPRRSPSPVSSYGRRASSADIIRVEPAVIEGPFSAPAARTAYGLLSPPEEGPTSPPESRSARSPSPVSTYSRSSRSSRNSSLFSSPTSPEYSGADSYPSPPEEEPFFAVRKRSRSPTPPGNRRTPSPEPGFGGRRSSVADDRGASSLLSPPEEPPRYTPLTPSTRWRSSVADDGGISAYPSPPNSPPSYTPSPSFKAKRPSSICTTRLAPPAKKLSPVRSGFDCRTATRPVPSRASSYNTAIAFGDNKYRPASSRRLF